MIAPTQDRALPLDGSTAPAVDVPSIDEAQRVLIEILRAPEFQPPEETYLSRMFDQLREWRDEFLMWLIRQLGLNEATGEVIGWIVLGLLTAVLLLVLFFVARSLLKAARDGRAETAKELSDTTIHGGASARARAALEAARRAAERGDLGAAMQALYQGVLYHLDGVGALRFADRKTAGEYGRELPVGERRTAWRSFVGAFQPVAWGGRAPTPGSWQAMRTAADDLGVPR